MTLLSELLSKRVDGLLAENYSLRARHEPLVAALVTLANRYHFLANHKGLRHRCYSLACSEATSALAAADAPSSTSLPLGESHVDDPVPADGLDP